MYNVIAATHNPAKIDAIQYAFDDTFGAGNCRVEGIDVDSGVPSQRRWAIIKPAAARATG